jgi:hypothetical protein
MLPFWGEEMKGHHPFRKGKGTYGATLGSHVEGWPENAAAADTQSLAASGLTQGGRQSVGSVGPTGYLDQILLWDQIDCRNGMGWEREILGPEENCGEEFEQTFEWKTAEIRIKPSFEIFSKIFILRFVWKDSKFKLVGVITLPASFGTPQNPRIEYITFDVTDMFYPYNAIFGRGLLNTFEATLHSGYLSLKIPATFGVISIFDSQKDARNIEPGFTPGHKNVHFLREK